LFAIIAGIGVALVVAVACGRGVRVLFAPGNSGRPLKMGDSVGGTLVMATICSGRHAVSKIRMLMIGKKMIARFINQVSF
jgi:hypothetical protein